MRCDKKGIEVLNTTDTELFIVADTEATCGIAVHLCTKGIAFVDGSVREVFRIRESFGNVKSMRGVKQRASKYLACSGLALA